MKSKWKGALIGGVVGFLIPWSLLIWGVIKGTPEIGFALQPIIIISIVSLPIGILIGYILGSRKKWITCFGLSGFFIPWVYFFYRYLDYINLPRIEQRGISLLFFNVLLISLIFLVIGVILGRIIDKK